MIEDYGNNYLLTGILVTILILVLGGSYVYFKFTNADYYEDKLNENIDAKDALIFNIDRAINIKANTLNFFNTLDNLEGSTHATITLKKNGNNVTGKYYLYLNIIKNEFIYTTDEKIPELILQVNGPDGLVTKLDMLEYKTVIDINGKEISGFDITEVNDLITIVSNKEVIDSKKIDKWEFKVILVNLNEEQKANEGKKFNGKLISQSSEVKSKFALACTGKALSKCMKENYMLEDNLYFHDVKLVNGANDNSIRYSGSSKSVENYVCFGDLVDGVCPHDSMYRIIGVFGDNIKLIKADYAKINELGSDLSSYEETSNGVTSKGANQLKDIAANYWKNTKGSGNVNTWANTSLYTTELPFYIKQINKNYQSKIVNFDWETRGIKNYNTTPVNIYYDEITRPLHIYSSSKVGLMYVSDYMYGAKPEYWNLVSFSDDDNDYRLSVDGNWMYMGLNEWSITKAQGTNSNAFAISSDGFITNVNVSDKNYAIRPCFYIDSKVILESGAGTIYNPFILK